MDIKTLSFSNDTLVVKPLCTALVARNAADFADSVLPLLQEGRRLELDLSSVGHMDGSGVGALISCRHAMRRLGCMFMLTHVQMHLAEDLEACGLQALLVPPAEVSAAPYWMQ